MIQYINRYSVYDHKRLRIHNARGGWQEGEPSTVTQPTGVRFSRNAAQTAYTVSWTAPTVTTGINGYYVSYNPTIYVSGATTTMASIPTKPTSVSVWSTADTAASATAAAPANAVPVPAATLAALPALSSGGDTGTGTPMGGTTNAAATGTRGAISFMLDAAALEAGDYIILHPATAMNGIDLATASNVSTTVVPDALWTDLEEFFRFGGGAIDLIGPAGSLDKDVVISEIMWRPGGAPPGGGTVRRVGGLARRGNILRRSWVPRQMRTRRGVRWRSRMLIGLRGTARAQSAPRRGASLD